MVKLIATAFFLVTLGIAADGAVLRSQVLQKGKQTTFFGDVAKGLATTAVMAATAPMQQQMAQQQMAQQQMMQQQMMQQQMAQQQGFIPTPEPVDIEKSEALDARQALLAKQLVEQQQVAEQLKAELEEIKRLGALQKPQGITAFQGTKTGSAALAALSAAGVTESMAEAFQDQEAPIIFLQPPPMQPKEQLSVDREVECALQRIGDKNSPAMKALNDYEMQKLGKTSAGTLEETQSEIKKTKSEIDKLRDERDELLNKLKKQGRELAKHCSDKLRAEIAFTNKDLEQKDKKISVLADKLATLKSREAALIKQKGPGKEAEKEEEKEEENEEEITGKESEEEE